MNICDKIQAIPGLYHLSGCKTTQISEAQKALDLEFPQEFIDYVRQFGAISFGGTEWTGLNVDGYLNVVEATMQERELNDGFPEDCFVLENLAIEGLLTLVNTKGVVYSYQSGKPPVMICQSISEYLDICTNNQA